MSPLEATVALNMLPKIGPIRVRRLLDAFGDAPGILRANREALIRVEGIGPETADILDSWQDRVDPTAEIREARLRGIHIVLRGDDNYPQPLTEVYDPPSLLYVWGDLLAQDRHAIGIVGSRRSSHYGIQATRKLSFQIAHAGFTVVSGLARGIDTAAHEAAVAAKGRTVAVIGAGLAQLYPPENMALAQRIAEGHGAVVSEFPLHKPPDKQTFPMRNRVVAAWSRGLLVTECPGWSGALITANLATEYGRPVFAVPGPIDRPGSAGCNQLIRDGATLVSDGSQLLEDLGELPLRPPVTPPQGGPATGSEPPRLAPQEQLVSEALDTVGLSIDQIIDRTGLPATVVGSTLMKLEMHGLARVLPGQHYAKCPR